MGDGSQFNPNPLLMPLIAKAITGFGKAYNKYEVKGVENVPKTGGVLLVLYHGLVPIDFWYLGLTLYQEIGRQPCALGDRWLFQTPLLSQFTEAVGGVLANRSTALKLLKEGVMMGVSPGGVKEAISGAENNYKLMWGKRQGFAELAFEANVPIVPGFTENIESAYKAPMAGHPFFQSLYEKTKLPLVPIIGLGPLPFPVKLTTWLGKPISPKTCKTPEALAKKTKSSIERLIKAHQKVL